jgi:hypothetical protein
MKHVNKIAAVLALSLLTVGCNDQGKINQVKQGSNKVVVVGDESKVTVKNLQTLFDELYESSNGGSVAAVNLAITEIAKQEIAKAGRTAEVETRVQEKLVELAKSTSYQFDGKFSEELLVSSLRTQNYHITGTEYSSDPENLKFDYTDYKERKLKLDVYKEMLNEQYILDVKSSLIRDKKMREVEYLTITYTDSTKLKAVSLMKEFEAAIRADANADFATFAASWNAYKKELIDKEIAKIGTDDDKTKTIENKYTNNNAYSIEYGKQQAYKAIDDSKLVTTKTLSFTSTNAAFDTETNNLIKNADFVEIGGVKYVPYSVDRDSIIINYVANSQYTIIRVLDVISADSNMASKIKAARVLAQSSANVKDSLLHYFEEYNLSVHDQDVADYLEATYSYTME